MKRKVFSLFSLSLSPRYVAFVGASGLFSAFACSSGHDLAPIIEEPDSGDSADDDDDQKTPLGGASNEGSGGADTGPAPDAGGGFATGGQEMFSLGGASTGPVVPPAQDSICEFGKDWNGNETLSLNTDGVQTLLSISSDELTIIFTTDDDLFIAEREDRNLEFSTPSALALPMGYDPSLGVTVGPEGLRLVFVQTGGGAFASLDRSSRSELFTDDASQEDFAILNRVPMTTLTQFKYPVLTAQGSQLWWMENQQNSSIWSATYQNAEQPWGVRVGCTDLGCDYLLEGDEDFEKAVTGVSEDGLTVFLDDEKTGSEARWRTHPNTSAGFFEAQSLGDRRAARPNANCSRIYYHRDGNIFFDEASD